MLAAVAVALAVAITTAAIYLMLRSQLYDQLDRDLLARAEAASSALDRSSIPILPSDALGTEVSSASEAFGESNLGGLGFRVRFVVGR